MSGPEEKEHIDLIIMEIMKKSNIEADFDQIIKFRKVAHRDYLVILDDIIEDTLKVPEAIRMEVLIKLCATLVLRDRMSNALESAT